MIMDLNPYDPVAFENQFANTDLCRDISKDFDNLWWDQQIKFFDNLTPRQAVSTVTLGFSMIPFYYLQLLLENNPKEIYDLGCGANLFKKYIPNIIGIDNGKSYTNADIMDEVDETFVKNHQNFFQSVFSINALHFRPLSQLRQVYEEFISMVAPGGRGFLSINLKRMIEQEYKTPEEMGIINTNIIGYERYVRTQLENLPCKYLIFDANLDPLDEWLDGNVRLVFEK